MTTLFYLNASEQSQQCMDPLEKSGIISESSPNISLPQNETFNSTVNVLETPTYNFIDNVLPMNHHFDILVREKEIQRRLEENKQTSQACINMLREACSSTENETINNTKNDLRPPTYLFMDNTISTHHSFNILERKKEIERRIEENKRHSDDCVAMLREANNDIYVDTYYKQYNASDNLSFFDRLEDRRIKSAEFQNHLQFVISALEAKTCFQHKGTFQNQPKCLCKISDTAYVQEPTLRKKYQDIKEIQEIPEIPEIQEIQEFQEIQEIQEIQENADNSNIDEIVPGAMGDNQEIGRKYSSDSLEKDSFYDLARKISNSLMETEQCHTCKERLSTDLRETVVGLIQVLDMMHDHRLQRNQQITVLEQNSDLQIAQSKTVFTVPEQNSVFTPNDAGGSIIDVESEMQFSTAVQSRISLSETSLDFQTCPSSRVTIQEKETDEVNINFKQICKSLLTAVKTISLSEIKETQSIPIQAGSTSLTYIQLKAKELSDLEYSAGEGERTLRIEDKTNLIITSDQSKEPEGRDEVKDADEYIEEHVISGEVMKNTSDGNIGLQEDEVLKQEIEECAIVKEDTVLEVQVPDDVQDANKYFTADIDLPENEVKQKNKKHQVHKKEYAIIVENDIENVCSVKVPAIEVNIEEDKDIHTIEAVITESGVLEVVTEANDTLLESIITYSKSGTVNIETEIISNDDYNESLEWKSPNTFHILVPSPAEDVATSEDQMIYVADYVNELSSTECNKDVKSIAEKTTHQMEKKLENKFQIDVEILDNKLAEIVNAKTEEQPLVEIIIEEDDHFQNTSNLNESESAVMFETTSVIEVKDDDVDTKYEIFELVETAPNLSIEIHRNDDESELEEILSVLEGLESIDEPVADIIESRIAVSPQKVSNLVAKLQEVESVSIIVEDANEAYFRQKIKETLENASMIVKDALIQTRANITEALEKVQKNVESVLAQPTTANKQVGTEDLRLKNKPNESVEFSKIESTGGMTTLTSLHPVKRCSSWPENRCNLLEASYWSAILENYRQPDSSPVLVFTTKQYDCIDVYGRICRNKIKEDNKQKSILDNATDESSAETISIQTTQWRKFIEETQKTEELLKSSSIDKISVENMKTSPLDFEHVYKGVSYPGFSSLSDTDVDEEILFSSYISDAVKTNESQKSNTDISSLLAVAESLEEAVSDTNETTELVSNLVKTEEDKEHNQVPMVSKDMQVIDVPDLVKVKTSTGCRMSIPKGQDVQDSRFVPQQVVKAESVENMVSINASKLISDNMYIQDTEKKGAESVKSITPGNQIEEDFKTASQHSATHQKSLSIEQVDASKLQEQFGKSHRRRLHQEGILRTKIFRSPEAEKTGHPSPSRRPKSPSDEKFPERSTRRSSRKSKSSQHSETTETKSLQVVSRLPLESAETRKVDHKEDVLSLEIKREETNGKTKPFGDSAKKKNFQIYNKQQKHPATCEYVDCLCNPPTPHPDLCEYSTYYSCALGPEENLKQVPPATCLQEQFSLVTETCPTSTTSNVVSDSQVLSESATNKISIVQIPYSSNGSEESKNVQTDIDVISLFHDSISHSGCDCYDCPKTLKSTTSKTKSSVKDQEHPQDCKCSLCCPMVILSKTTIAIKSTDPEECNILPVQEVNTTLNIQTQSEAIICVETVKTAECFVNSSTSTTGLVLREEKNHSDKHNSPRYCQTTKSIIAVKSSTTRFLEKGLEPRGVPKLAENAQIESIISLGTEFINQNKTYFSTECTTFNAEELEETTIKTETLDDVFNDPKQSITDVCEAIKEAGCIWRTAENYALHKTPIEKSFMAVQKSSFRLTLISLRLALEAAQKKCRQKDELVLALINELRLRTNNMVLEELFSTLSSTRNMNENAIDYNKTKIYRTPPRSASVPRCRERSVSPTHSLSACSTNADPHPQLITVSGKSKNNDELPCEATAPSVHTWSTTTFSNYNIINYKITVSTSTEEVASCASLPNLSEEQVPELPNALNALDIIHCIFKPHRFRKTTDSSTQYSSSTDTSRSESEEYRRINPTLFVNNRSTKSVNDLQFDKSSVSDLQFDKSSVRVMHPKTSLASPKILTVRTNMPKTSTKVSLERSNVSPGKSVLSRRRPKVIRPYSTVLPISGKISKTVSPINRKISPTISPILQRISPTISSINRKISRPVSERISSSVLPMCRRISPTVSSISRPISSPVSSLSHRISPTVSMINEKISLSVSSISRKISSPVSSISGRISPTISSINRKISLAVSRRISPSVLPICRRISPTVSPISRPISSPVSSISYRISPTASIINEKIFPLVSSISRKISSPVSSISGRMSPTLSSISGKISRKVSPISNEISPPVSSISGRMSPTLSSISGKISRKVSPISNEISPPVSSISGRRPPTLSSISGKISRKVSPISNKISPPVSLISGRTSQRVSPIKERISPFSSTGQKKIMKTKPPQKIADCREPLLKPKRQSKGEQPLQGKSKNNSTKNRKCQSPCRYPTPVNIPLLEESEMSIIKRPKYISNTYLKPKRGTKK